MERWYGLIQFAGWTDGEVISYVITKLSPDLQCALMSELIPSVDHVWDFLADRFQSDSTPSVLMELTDLRQKPGKTVQQLSVHVEILVKRAIPKAVFSNLNKSFWRLCVLCRNPHIP